MALLAFNASIKAMRSLAASVSRFSKLKLNRIDLARHDTHGAEIRHGEVLIQASWAPPRSLDASKVSQRSGRIRTKMGSDCSMKSLMAVM